MLFQRHPNNPILSGDAWPYAANSVFNAGATVFDNETLLLCRVEDRQGISHFTVARSSDGLTGWRIENSPTLAPDPSNYPREIWGIEDPRLVKVDEEPFWAITYTAFSQPGPLVCLARTQDFKKFERLGIILPPESRNAAIFHKKIKNKYWMLHRPTSRSADIWVCTSPDLKHWGNHHLVFQSRDGGWWDSQKIGAGPPPLWTPEGWLLAYHGAKDTVRGPIYRMGLALLDLDDPRNVISRPPSWVFGPGPGFERTGDVPNVAFSCGWTFNPQTNEIRLYYGAADTSIGVATASLPNLMDFLKQG